MAAPWYSVATHFKGLSEVHGAVDNPKIVEMFRVSGHPEVQDDETPWCAAFVGACLRLSGYKSSGSLGARSYLNFGRDLQGTPQRGCIVVFWRGEPDAATGHVAFYDRDAGANILVLGGNQGDAVTLAPFPKKRVLGYRMPVETASLPTDTSLPNILTIDPGNAPAHVLGAAAGARGAAEPEREARATSELSDGAVGPQVRALQEALNDRGFQLGDVDGEFGPLTATAVGRFQTAQRLPVTGRADIETQRALGVPVPAFVPSPSSSGVVTPPWQPPPIASPSGGASMESRDLVKMLIDAVLARHQQGGAAGPQPAQPQAGADPGQVVQALLGALLGGGGAPAAGGAAPLTPSPGPSPTGTTPAILSPIDKLLGGEALAGKKTTLAVLAYAVLSVMQTMGAAGTFGGDTKTATGQILTTLIASFGGLGLLGKVDRVVKILGVIAARRPGA